jgi:hypothetical protein
MNLFEDIQRRATLRESRAQSGVPVNKTKKPPRKGSQQKAANGNQGDAAGGPVASGAPVPAVARAAKRKNRPLKAV